MKTKSISSKTDININLAVFNQPVIYVVEFESLTVITTSGDEKNEGQQNNDWEM